MTIEQMQQKMTASEEAALEIHGGEGKPPRGAPTEGVTGERSEAGATGGGAPLGRARPVVKSAPDPEVQPNGRRRIFSATYKARIVAQADSCETGELGSLLRREGLFYSTISRWRKQRDAGMLKGLTPQKRGPSPDPDKALRQRNAQLEKENQRLAKRLSNAELIIDVQKKVAMLLGLPLAANDLDEGERK